MRKRSRIKTVTLKEARRRSGLDLLGEWQLTFTDYELGRHGNVAHWQRWMARRYPRHQEMIDRGIEYFGKKGYEIYPRGLAVNGTYACSDFAFLRGNKITFVECLSAVWTDRKTLQKKLRLAQHGKLVFIVENPASADLKSPTGER